MSTEELFFNGIDAVTGQYLMPSMTPEQLSRVALGEVFDEKHLNDLKARKDRPDHFVLEEGKDPKDLAQTGWGVIFPYGSDPAIKDALSPLLEHRQKQAGELYQEFIGPKAYRPGETKTQFVSRHGGSGGSVDPNKIPYYLLIVGDPETIPYSFQYQLDVQYAVGRIHFDRLEDYAQYAQSVVEAERKNLLLSRHASFFGVHNHGDRATELSTHYLIKPLAELLEQDRPDWQIQKFIKEQATKAQLAQLLGGNGKDLPSLLFTASHGMGFDNTPDHPLLLNHQGALICQDWPGAGTPPTEDHYFCADDIASDANLWGLIAFHFACYSAGSPKMSDFSHRDSNISTDGQQQIAPRSFVARLPQRLLSHPKGGALAVIGHVDRAWGCSFFGGSKGNKAESQLSDFKSTLKRLMDGHPVGSALEFFNQRYSEASSDVTFYIQETKYGVQFSAREITQAWTLNNDARNYTILGDPAVKLCVSHSQDNQIEKPVRETVNFSRSSQATKPVSEESVLEPENLSNQVFSVAALKESQEFLIEALDQFVTTIQTAPEEKVGQFKLALSTANLLMEMLKSLN